MREIVERDPQEGGDGENLDDVGAACHRYNSNLQSKAAALDYFPAPIFEPTSAV
jgi:hypothetical protein